MFNKTLGTTITIDEMPALNDIGTMFSSLRRGRGHGEDSLPNELYLCDPDFWSTVVHPLLLKSFCRVQEPLPWKGGMLIDIFKGSGDRTDPKNSRGVFIEDSLAKIYHSWLRRRLMLRYQKVAHSATYGGTPKRGTDMCAHQALAAWELAHAMKVSMAQVFVDIVGAFDGLVRQVVMGYDDLPVGDAAIITLLAALGFGPDSVHDLAHQLSQGSILEKADVPQEVRRAVGDAHSHTWFSVQGCRPVSEALSGSRPGDPLGDIIFNFVETSIHAEIGEGFADAPFVLVLPPLPEKLQTPFLPNDPAEVKFNNYVDDDAFPMIAETPRLMLDYLGQAIAVIARAFRRHCLTLNLKANKTEVMISFVGKGAKQALKELVIDNESLVRVSGDDVCPGSPDLALRAVAWYRHMGHATSSGGGFLQEAKHRAAETFSAYRSLRRRVVRNSLLLDHTRISLSKSLMHSRLFYGAALWHCESTRAMRVISHAYTVPIRDSLGMMNVDAKIGTAVPKVNLTTDAQVLVQAGLPRALTRARIDRMRYACRLFANGPDLLVRLALACFEHAGSWTREVFLDFQSVWISGAEFASHLPGPILFLPLG